MLNSVTVAAVQSFKDEVIHFLFNSAPHPICSHPTVGGTLPASGLSLKKNSCLLCDCDRTKSVTTHVMQSALVHAL
jgi:hypothetical protein